MIFRLVSTVLLSSILVAVPISNLKGMGKDMHILGRGEIGGIFDLTGTPVESGGIGNYPEIKIRSAQKWIDNPSQQTGQYKVNKIGGKILSPSNHGHLRHNPQMVENVFKSNGAARNIARMHKIQDVFNNKAGVDGWNATSQMRKEAEVILRYVRRYKRLPGRLPGWVDYSGPLIKNGGVKTVKSLAGNAVGGSNTLSQLPKTGAKFIVPLGVALSAGMAIHRHASIENAFENGEITDTEKRHRQTENTIKTIGELALMGAILVVPVSGPALVVLAGGVVAYVIVDYTTSALAAAYNNWQDELIERKTELLTAANVAGGIFDITPELLAAAGVKDAELQAYTKAYNESVRVEMDSNLGVHSGFDMELWVYEALTDFYADSY